MDINVNLATKNLFEGKTKLLHAVFIWGLFIPFFLLIIVEKGVIFPLLEYFKVPPYYYPFRLPVFLYFIIFWFPIWKCVSNHPGKLIWKYISYLYLIFIVLSLLLLAWIDYTHMVNLAHSAGL